MTDSAGKTPKTVKLYDQDAYSTEFEARILSSGVTDGSVRLILDRTLFFPEGGGQSADTGEIQGFKVLDVQISDDIITHIISVEADSALPADLEEGQTVRGRIDWERRFSNMQNHTGEHILSGILHNDFSSENVGFHLSDNTITLDTSRYLNQKQLLELEIKANRAVYANIPITVTYPEEEELKSMEYRSKKAVDGPLRLVTIGELDRCACCAPHLRSTGEAGTIKIIKAIKWKEGTRIWFLCGERALKYIEEIFANVDEAAHITSEPPEKIADGIKRFSDNINSLKQRLFEARSQYLMEKLSNLHTEKTNVILFENIEEPKVIRNAVNYLTEHYSGICGIFFSADEGSYQYIIGSRSADCRLLGREINERLRGKGGGKPEMIQGSVTAAKQAIIDVLKETIDI